VVSPRESSDFWFDGLGPTGSSETQRDIVGKHMKLARPLRCWLAVFLLATIYLAVFQPACGYYNPSTGRWLSRDPAPELSANPKLVFVSEILAGGNGELNSYEFVNNVPLELIDGCGLEAEKPVCACKCKSVTISYDPKPKDGKLRFNFYKNPNTHERQYGFKLHVNWDVDGDPLKCTYAVNEPSGGVTGSIAIQRN
jgi:hypothetical protein